jgi:hypothetical protein
MTKDQASDLRSYIDNVRIRTVAHEQAEAALSAANARLETFLYKLEHENNDRPNS